ncbi:MAG: motility protein A [Candidatus Marinimicrobia bacterium]|nr:motility protein A [Candidatus Neomarinimicrobiota bacterium]MCF7841153.1 motility protein A [Candidatus Neomarinimicrobiota bacterium]MCF7901946.1 motility protein A [Candidatus Neomarinimicrobiota bacterium]
MDLATILGILSGLFLVWSTIVAGGNLETFVHIPSMMIVMGGATAATLVNFTSKEVLGVLGVVRKAFAWRKTDDMEVVRQFTNLSLLARREGILAIDRELSNIKDKFMRIGLELAVDGAEPDTIRDVMETELNYLMVRHARGQQIFLSLGAYAPAFGLLGTLIGLISMLKNLDDPSNIGEGMAIALITTFYGSFLANLLFLPIAGKLKNRTNEEIVRKQMISEGVLAIQNGEHPNTIEKKLMNYLPPKNRVASKK